MHEFAGSVAFVAAYDVAVGPVEMTEPGQAEADQHAVHSGGHQAHQVSDAGRSPPPCEADLDDPAFGPGRRAPRTVAGRLERSLIPASPSLRYRPARRWVVVGETWNRSAAWRRAHPSSITQRASRRRPVSVRGALRWGMRAFRAGVDVAIHTEPGRPSCVQDHQAETCITVHNLPGQNT